MTTAYVIDVPATFASDHVDRELPTGKLINRTAKLWTFVCNEDEIIEWYSDADYYSDPAIVASMRSSCGPGIIGLQSSARATLKRLRPHFEQGPQALRDQARQQLRVVFKEAI